MSLEVVAFHFEDDGKLNQESRRNEAEREGYTMNQ